MLPSVESFNIHKKSQKDHKSLKKDLTSRSWKPFSVSFFMLFFFSKKVLLQLLSTTYSNFVLFSTTDLAHFDQQDRFDLLDHFDQFDHLDHFDQSDSFTLHFSKQFSSDFSNFSKMSTQLTRKKPALDYNSQFLGENKTEKTASL